jgi:hypothetical protein
MGHLRIPMTPTWLEPVRVSPACNSPASGAESTKTLPLTGLEGQATYARITGRHRTLGAKSAFVSAVPGRRTLFASCHWTTSRLGDRGSGSFRRSSGEYDGWLRRMQGTMGTGGADFHRGSPSQRCFRTAGLVSGSVKVNPSNPRAMERQRAKTKAIARAGRSLRQRSVERAPSGRILLALRRAAGDNGPLTL